MDWKNLSQRVAVGVLFIPLILAASWWGNIWFLLLIEIIIVAGLFEYFALARRKHVRPQAWIGVIGGGALAPLLYFGMASHLWVVTAGLLVILLLAELFAKPDPAGSPLLNVASTFFGVAYVAGLLSFLVLIRELPRATGGVYAQAGAWVVMIFVVIWVCDTAAYFTGMCLGKRKLFARVSPKKTVAGAVGGFVFAVLAALACQQTFAHSLREQDAAVIGALIGSIGQMSDLVESLLKRDAGVKDSSQLIPGHGGVLDRFDSEMLIAPLVYFYLLMFGIS